jgi:YkoY family integral membrane protein
MFGQTFEAHDLVVVGVLVVLEGVLSIDNALVLGLMAKRLPRHYQNRALTYGLVGAFAFRIVAVVMAAWLLHWHFVKFLGGLYLVYVAVKHLIIDRKRRKADAAAAEGGSIAGKAASFWPTVMVIELTDMAFAVDSILAAIALVGAAPEGGHVVHPKLWVVLTGGMLGVVLMRAAAVVFIRLLERWPRFETAAYLLVAVIGAKLLVDWAANEPGAHRVDFHDWQSPAFWIFWILMAACFLYGFVGKKPLQQPG